MLQTWPPKRYKRDRVSFAEEPAGGAIPQPWGMAIFVVCPFLDIAIMLLEHSAKGSWPKKENQFWVDPYFFAQDQTRIHVKTLQASIKNGTKPSCGQKWAQVGIRTTCNIRLEGLCWGFNRLKIDMNIGLPAKKLMGGDLGRHDGGYWCQVGAKKGPRSFKIPEKSFKIVAKMVQDRGLEEVWAALGAYRGVLVVSWGVSGVSCSVLGAS